MKDRAELAFIAKRVDRYTPPDKVLENIDRFLCLAMARASWEDLLQVRRMFPLAAFKKAYQNAPRGLFDRRACVYWGIMLFDDVTIPMPERFSGANQFDWRRSQSLPGHSETDTKPA